tara:strand:+ start:1591 stop:1767 length:177 start_codon:yes stop_codon:yes gene_type:complete
VQSDNIQNIKDVTLEELIILLGSYIFNGGSLSDIQTDVLLDIYILLELELEKREAVIH